MYNYKSLEKQILTSGKYSIVPIRFQDRFDIMKWRNEQMYHLRQNEPLTKEKQDSYFNNIISKLFNEEKPIQILFSYLQDEKCIGYGGLVHINWVDKNAEISFVMRTELEKNAFEFHWIKYLGLIEEVAKDLQLHKIFTYAFDLRPHLYVALEKAAFYKEATLKDHCLHQNKFLDVILHSKILNNKLRYREATIDDAKLLYEWVNQKEVRQNSLSTSLIAWENHLKWFKNKLKDEYSHIFIFFWEKKPIGQVRLDLEKDSWAINYSVDKEYRGKGLGTKILQEILNFENFENFAALVKKDNIGSRKVFEKLNFEQVLIENESDKILFKFLYSKK